MILTFLDMDTDWRLVTDTKTHTERGQPI